MKFVDTHAHLNDEKLYESREEIYREAMEEGLGFIVCVGYDIASSHVALKIANEFENVFATVGIHPNSANQIGRIQELEELLSKQKVVALGEIGLDYYWMKFPKDVQIKALEIQIELASKHNLPIVLHTRDAFEDMLDVLTSLKPRKVVFHSYSADKEVARRILDMGYYISFSGMITFNNPHLKEAVKYVPLERMLSETDAPYLTPKPYRGRINKPSYVRYIVQAISELKGMDVDEVKESIWKNALEVFNISYQDPSPS